MFLGRDGIFAYEAMRAMYLRDGIENPKIGELITPKPEYAVLNSEFINVSMTNPEKAKNIMTTIGITEEDIRNGKVSAK